VSSPDSSPPLTRNIFFSALSSASAGLLLLLMAAATRSLSADAFGQFQWALTFAVMGETLMDLGLQQLTMRAIARDRTQAPRLLHNSLALKALTGLGMFVVMSGIACLLRPEPEVRTACFLLLASAICRSYLLTMRGVLTGLERFGHESAIVVGDRLLVLMLGAYALLQGWGLIGLCLMFVVARVIAVVGALMLTRPVVGGLTLAFDTALWRALQREALPMGAFLVVLNVYSYIDTVMLGVLSTDADTGAYAAAYRIYEGLSYLPGILSAALTPRLARLWSADRAAHVRLAWRGLGAAAGLALLAGGPVWLLARPLLTLVFTGGSAVDYGQAASTLRILVAGLPFIFVIWMLQAVATAVFLERLLLKTAAIGALLNVALNLFLIPRYGRDGAAFATLVGEALTMTLLFWGLRSVLRGSTTDRGPASSTR
jgi:O-antigen/teichoic acid export membrane protein